MRFIWDEAKRKSNLSKHGYDFADAYKVFQSPLVLAEDSRDDYGEQRMLALGLLDAVVVLIVHVESDDSIHLYGDVSFGLKGWKEEVCYIRFERGSSIELCS